METPFASAGDERWFAIFTLLIFRDHLRVSGLSMDFFVTGALSNRGFVGFFPYVNQVILIYATPGSILPWMALLLSRQTDARGTDKLGFRRILGIPANRVRRRGKISRRAFGGMALG